MVLVEYPIFLKPCHIFIPKNMSRFNYMLQNDNLVILNATYYNLFGDSNLKFYIWLAIIFPGCNFTTPIIHPIPQSIALVLTVVSNATVIWRYLLFNFSLVSLFLAAAFLILWINVLHYYSCLSKKTLMSQCTDVIHISFFSKEKPFVVTIILDLCTPPHILFRYCI